tara:strand:- start:2252 stop:2899 length:648 start_codon:yes stop_codon:yes gene_type:complete
MFTKDDIIVIPARKGSKGVPFKNRKLIQSTLDIIPKEYNDLVYITTDDDFIVEKYNDKYKVIVRDSEYAQDETTIKDTMVDFFNSIDKDSGRCLMLYTVYPNREWLDVVRGVGLFEKENAKSLLCKKEYGCVHPYLLLVENGHLKGRQLVQHNLCRRQDYPKVFELTHYVTIFEIGGILDLNNNLYNDGTIYLPLKSDIIDIDNQKDILLWEKQK